MRRMLILLFAGILLSGPALAQSADRGPSYQETVNWLLSKVGELGFAETDRSYVSTGTVLNNTLSYTDMSFGECELRFTSVLDIVRHDSHSGDSRSLSEASVGIPLQKISGVTARDGKGYVILPASNAEYWMLEFASETEAIRTSRRDSQDGGNTWSPLMKSATKVTRLYVGLPGSDHQDIATRMQRAFQNLVQYCKANAPRSNEPY